MSTATSSSSQSASHVLVLTPSASSGSQSTTISSTWTQSDSNPGTLPSAGNISTQLDDYLGQDKFDDGTPYGRIVDDSSSPSLATLDTEAAYEVRAHAKIETFNDDFHN